MSNKCDIAKIFNKFFVNIASHLPEPYEEQSSNHPSVTEIGNVMQSHSSSDQFMFKSMQNLKSLSLQKQLVMIKFLHVLSRMVPVSSLTLLHSYLIPQ